MVGTNNTSKVVPSPAQPGPHSHPPVHPRRPLGPRRSGPRSHQRRPRSRPRCPMKWASTGCYLAAGCVPALACKRPQPPNAERQQWRLVRPIRTPFSLTQTPTRSRHWYNWTLARAILTAAPGAVLTTRGTSTPTRMAHVGRTQTTLAPSNASVCPPLPRLDRLQRHQPRQPRHQPSTTTRRALPHRLTRFV